MTKGQFISQVHTRFRVMIQGGPPVELEMDEVEEAKSTPTHEQFSLLFYGPKDAPLIQGSFEIEHAVLGSFPLFLVPIQPDAKGPRYQAVFNRFMKPQA